MASFRSPLEPLGSKSADGGWSPTLRSGDAARTPPRQGMSGAGQGMGKATLRVASPVEMATMIEYRFMFELWDQKYYDEHLCYNSNHYFISKRMKAYGIFRSDQ